MIYEDKKRVYGKWYASVRYIDRNGLRHTDKRYGFETEKDAFRWEAAFHLRRLCVPENVLFDDILAAYCKVFHPRQIEKHIRTYFSGVPVAKITVEVMEDYWRYLQDYRYAGGAKGLSSYAKNHSLQQLYAILESVVFFGNQEDKEDKSDEKFLGPPVVAPAPSMKTVLWTKKDYVEFSSVVRDEVPVYLASALAFWAHIQASDIRCIRVCDYDAGNRVLNVNVKIRKSDLPREADGEAKKHIVKPVSLPESYAEKLDRYIQLMHLFEEDYLFPVSNDLMNFRLIFGAETMGLPYIDSAGLYASGLCSEYHNELTDVPTPLLTDTLVERRSSSVYTTASILTGMVQLGNERSQYFRELWLKMFVCCLRDLRDIWQSHKNAKK